MLYNAISTPLELHTLGHFEWKRCKKWIGLWNAWDFFKLGYENTFKNLAFVKPEISKYFLHAAFLIQNDPECPHDIKAQFTRLI